MTTLIPRPSYTREELDRLYPQSVQLQLVQVVSRWSFLSMIEIAHEEEKHRGYSSVIFANGRSFCAMVCEKIEQ